MAANSNQGNGSQQLLVVNDIGGVHVIDRSTPLKRLNYFDGKFLRAADLALEQGYLRQLVAISNQGLGSGVVYGYDTVLGSGDTVQVGPGLAIDAGGKVLLLQSTVTQSISALIEASKKTQIKAPDASGKSGSGVFDDCVQAAAPAPTAVVSAGDIYVIAICSTEALCGQEDVFGIACQDACVTTTARPYRLDGIMLRAIPLPLTTGPLVSEQVSVGSDLYLRSQIAHRWFADEALKHPDAISREGLLSGAWCLGAGYFSACCEVPLAVVARSGSTTLFLDAWTVRRERIDAPAKRYWQWKMRMRPWDVFLAQILQFQCQLHQVLADQPQPETGDEDSCASLIAQAAATIAAITRYYKEVAAELRQWDVLSQLKTKPIKGGLAELSAFEKKLLQARNAFSLIPTERVLIAGGIVELPSAGYLPVAPGPLPVNEQVRRLLGEGVDLRFCVVRTDFVAHALEEAQHLDRISLLWGLDHPDDKPKLDILVPDGTIVTGAVSPAAEIYAAEVRYSAEETGALLAKGAGREEILATGGTAVYSAGAGVSQGVAGNAYTLLRRSKLFDTQKSTVVSEKAEAGQGLGLTPNFARSEFLQADRLSSARFDSLLRQAAAASRQYVQVAAIARAKTATAATFEVMRPDETVNGYWLTFRSEKRIKDLGIYEQTRASGRAILAHFAAVPLAVEARFEGPLTVIAIEPAVAGGDLTITASAQLTVTATVTATLDLNPTQPGKEAEAESSATFLVKLGLMFTYGGSDSEGAVTLDFLDAAGNPLNPSLQVVKSYKQSSSWILYELFFGYSPVYKIPLEYRQRAPSSSGFLKLGELGFVGDNDVARPANDYHRKAEGGLDVIQAALALGEPLFGSVARKQLFPELPPATEEITIQALRDWVLFHRRRDKQCTAVVEKSEILPPRSYRIYHIDGQSEGTVQEWIAYLEREGGLSGYVRKQAYASPDLVVKFAGGSAEALFDPEAAATDWQSFNPGGTIAYVAYGAVGDDDELLQTQRLHRYETAIRGISKESIATVHRPLVPFSGPLPPDAEGLMLFITLNIDKRERLIPFGKEVPAAEAPEGSVQFRNGEPQGTAPDDYVAGLKAYIEENKNTIQGIRYLWVASTTESDTAAEARGNILRDKLKDAGLLTSAGELARVQSSVLSEEHKAGLKGRHGADVLNGIDDVILIEFEHQPYVLSDAISVKKESAGYDPEGRKLKMKLTLTNNGDTAVRLGEYFAASVRFLNPNVFEDVSGPYPEDLMVTDGLEVSDDTEIAPGETRTVEVTVNPAEWAVPDRSFAGLLFFFDAQGNRHIVPVVPNPDIIVPVSAPGHSARILVIERNPNSGEVLVLGDPDLDIGFDASHKLVDGDLPPAATAWLKDNIGARSISRIFLVTGEAAASPAVTGRIETLREALGIHLTLLKPETPAPILTPDDVQAQFGGEADMILKALNEPKPAQDLIVLEVGLG